MEVSKDHVVEVEMDSPFQVMDLVQVLDVHGLVYDHPIDDHPIEDWKREVALGVKALFANGRSFGNRFTRVYLWVDFEMGKFGLTTRTEVVQDPPLDHFTLHLPDNFHPI
jgi:hypothetical protein